MARDLPIVLGLLGQLASGFMQGREFREARQRRTEEFDLRKRGFEAQLSGERERLGRERESFEAEKAQRRIANIASLFGPQSSEVATELGVDPQRAKAGQRLSALSSIFQPHELYQQPEARGLFEQAYQTPYPTQTETIPYPHIGARQETRPVLPRVPKADRPTLKEAFEALVLSSPELFGQYAGQELGTVEKPAKKEARREGLAVTLKGQEGQESRFRRSLSQRETEADQRLDIELNRVITQHDAKLMKTDLLPIVEDFRAKFRYAAPSQDDFEELKRKILEVKSKYRGQPSVEGGRLVPPKSREERRNEKLREMWIK